MPSYLILSWVVNYVFIYAKEIFWSEELHELWALGNYALHPAFTHLFFAKMSHLSALGKELWSICLRLMLRRSTMWLVAIFARPNGEEDFFKSSPFEWPTILGKMRYSPWRHELWQTSYLRRPWCQLISFDLYSPSKSWLLSSHMPTSLQSTT